MRFVKLVAAIFLTFAVGSALADTIKVPAKNPLVTVTVPDSWKPEKTDRGIAFESPDDVVTMLFEVAASEKAMGGIVDDNIDWLVKEQDVKIDGASRSMKPPSTRSWKASSPRSDLPPAGARVRLGAGGGRGAS